MLPCYDASRQIWHREKVKNKNTFSVSEAAHRLGGGKRAGRMRGASADSAGRLQPTNTTLLRNTICLVPRSARIGGWRSIMMP